MTEQAVVPYQALDFARGDWQISEAKFNAMHNAVSLLVPEIGDLSDRTVTLTLAHRQSGEQVSATFHWSGTEWLCPERRLRVGGNLMWTAIVRGFQAARQTH